MAVFSSEIVPGEGLAAFGGVGFGSLEEDGKVFARVNDQIWQAVRGKRSIEAPIENNQTGPEGRTGCTGPIFRQWGGRPHPKSWLGSRNTNLWHLWM